MEDKRGSFIFNYVLITMLVLCLVISGMLIVLSTSKKETRLEKTSGNQINNSYADEELSSNTWDVSHDQDGSVIATLAEDGTLTISGTGKMLENIFTLEIQWDKILSKIHRIIIENGVTSIGDYTFEGCNNLTSVEIANSVTSIGESAFSYCDKLTIIEIPSSVTSIGYMAFDGCSSLTEIKVNANNTTYKDDNGVLYTKDGKQLIKYPEAKSEIEYTILSGTISIEDKAFSNCYNLTKIEIPNSVTSIGFMAFDSCFALTNIEIPSGVTNIGFGAFDGCGRLQNIEVSDNNENYKDVNGILYTEDETTIIKYPEGKIDIEYTILSNTTRVEESAFSSNQNLTNVELPNGIEEIGDSAFFYCEKLTNIKIPSSVIKIGYEAFSGCSSLRYIEVSKENENYKDDNGVLYTNDGIRLIQYPMQKEGSEYTILAGTILIESSAFENCIKLTDIIIPNTVENIEYGAFEGCTNISTIEIPYSVTYIGSSAFDGCSSLKYIKISKENEKYKDDNGVLYTKDGKELMKYPEGKEEKEYIIHSSTKRIKNGAFSYCKNLIKLEIPSTVTEIDSGAFYGNENLIIICERGSMAETYAKKMNIRYIIKGEEDIITSPTLTIDKENLIIKDIQPNSSVEEIIEQIDTTATEINIYNKNNERLNNTDKVGTGMKVELKSGDQMVSYTIIVKADTNGDGIANINDIFRINSHRLGINKITGVYLEAADVNGDGVAEVKDIFKINSYRLKGGQI